MHHAMLCKQMPWDSGIQLVLGQCGGCRAQGLSTKDPSSQKPQGWSQPSLLFPTTSTLHSYHEGGLGDHLVNGVGEGHAARAKEAYMLYRYRTFL